MGTVRLYSLGTIKMAKDLNLHEARIRGRRISEGKFEKMKMDSFCGCSEFSLVFFL